MTDHSAEKDAPECACVGYHVRTDYGTGTEYDVDSSSCPAHAAPSLPTHGRGPGWLTACGQDRANVRYWTDDVTAVTCGRCRVIPPEKGQADA